MNKAPKLDAARSKWPTDLPADPDFDSLIDADYGLLQYHFVEFVIAHLSDCSRVFGGDLQEMLVLGLIGQVFLRRYNSGARIEDEADHSAISASRIADILGVPRETVRRKLQSLSERGWIVQTDHSMWKLKFRDGASVAREELSELDRRGRSRMAKAVLTLSPLLKAALEKAEKPK